jgi:hypothetical protein
MTDGPNRRGARHEWHTRSRFRRSVDRQALRRFNRRLTDAEYLSAVRMFTTCSDDLRPTPRELVHVAVALAPEVSQFLRAYDGGKPPEWAIALSNYLESFIGRVRRG